MKVNEFNEKWVLYGIQQAYEILRESDTFVKMILDNAGVSETDSKYTHYENNVRKAVIENAMNSIESACRYMNIEDEIKKRKPVDWLEEVNKIYE